MLFYGNMEQVHYDILQKMVEHFPKAFGRCFFGDNNILLNRTLSFLDDPKFVGSMTSTAQDVQERSLALRLNTLVWAFDNALHLEGDIVECGVFKGFSFAFLTHYFGFQDVAKTLWLYDTFGGIPEGYDPDNLDSDNYHEPGLYEGVLERFKAYPNVKVVQGALPGSLQGNAPEKIAFLHIDLNSERSEMETLEVLFDRIVPGGMIVFDDYGWQAYRKQHFAEKAWAAERGYLIFELPTGQGVLLKR